MFPWYSPQRHSKDRPWSAEHRVDVTCAHQVGVSVGRPPSTSMRDSPIREDPLESASIVSDLPQAVEISIKASEPYPVAIRRPLSRPDVAILQVCDLPHGCAVASGSEQF